MAARFCFDCSAALSAGEQEFYGFRCEECETDHYIRVNRWRAGGDDPEFDDVYDEPTKKVGNAAQ